MTLVISLVPHIFLPNKKTFRLLLFYSLISISFTKIFAQEKDNETHFDGFHLNKIDSAEKWSYHFQLTGIAQGHTNFNSAYSGKNSIVDTGEIAVSLTSTLFLGRKLWKGAAIYVNPEIAGGKGMSYALGLAGAANGETFRIGSPEPKVYIARAFFQQHIKLKNSDKEFQEGDLNQLGEFVPSSRITITAGKFSIADFYDDNAYSHDPRSQFLNWSLMSNGAWDYPADTRGYTWGLVAELIKPKWAIRLSSVMMPARANGPDLDANYTKAHAETIEIERKLNVNNHPGCIKLLGFQNYSSAPTYNDAINTMKSGDSTLYFTIGGQRSGIRYGGVKYGFGLSIWQEFTKNFGVFARVSWNDGKSSTWAFTEIDHSVSLGLSLKMGKIKRADDIFGLAAVINGISSDHYDYLNNGGYGFIIGDGKLTRYTNEIIIESYYKIKLFHSLWLTADYQCVLNPAYNVDRGPVNIFSLRAHVEF